MSVVGASGFGRVRSIAVGSGRCRRAGWRCRGSLVFLGRVAIALPVAACSSAPTMDLFGSYFPAWMPCAAIAVVAAIIIRQIPARSRLDY